LDNSRHRAFGPGLRAATFVVITLGLLACAETFRVAGTGSAASAAALATHVEQLFEAFVTRFGPNVYEPKFAAARIKLGQSALVPSRIFDDTSVWTLRPTPNTRFLFAAGGPGADGRYHVESRASLPGATRPGESRHSIALEKVASNQFRWDTRVDLSIGQVTPDEVASAFNALLAAPEGRVEKTVRDDYRTAFPRAMAVFGKGFVLDSMTITPGALGTTTVQLRFAYRSELMRPAYPMLASYLDKYLGPAKSRVVLADRAGTVMFEELGRDRWMSFRYRLRDGKLISLYGAPKPMPDTLQLIADVSLKVKLFTVGFHELNAQFVNYNTSSGNNRDRGWEITAQREPKWDLPMLTERLLRAPLQHPFEGEGVLFRIGVLDDDTAPTAQTELSRRSRLDVQESAITHFLGSLVSHALGDLDERVEQDEHRFVHDGFEALQADLRAMGGRGRE
jgi:hypothetical protein